MNGTAFDGWTRRLHSRRGVVPVLVGLGLGIGITRPTGGAPRASHQDKNGKRPRLGCTKQDNACTAPPGAATACPDVPVGSGASCVKDNKGKPFCAGSGDCAPCKTNRDCAAVGPGALCIKKCPICKNDLGGFSSACLAPFVS